MTPILTYYANKYFQNVRPSDLKLSLWGEIDSSLHLTPWAPHRFLTINLLSLLLRLLHLSPLSQAVM